MPAPLRLTLGAFEILALSDGAIPFRPEIIVHADPAAVAASLAQAAGSDPLRGQVNLFVLRRPGRVILIDAGGLPALIPTLGAAPGQLGAAGVRPQDVDQILLTHLHIDHIGLLLDATGAAAFPRATLSLMAEEYRYWSDPARLSGAPDGLRAQGLAAQAVLRAYGDRLVLLRDDDEAAPGVRAVLIAGHTPGMAGFEITSGRERLLMWGDVIHLPALQFRHVDWHLSFDTDGAAAAASRARILRRVAAEAIPVLGSHLPYPGLGRVETAREGYRFEPLAGLSSL